MTKILVVEDNPVNLDLVTQLLEDDFELVTAGDGAAALQELDQAPFDLVIMDLSLPVLDGWTAIRQIRLRATGARTPIIALSAHAHQEDIQRAFSAGCDAYLTKPLDEDELLATIQRLLTAAGKA